MKEIRAFQCEYGCGYYKKTKKSVDEHEGRCFFNPIRRACASCGHNKRDSETIYNPAHGGDPGSTDFEEYYYFCEVLEFKLWKETFKFNCKFWVKNIV